MLLYEKKEEDNFMKKKLAMLLTAAMLVGSLAACGSSDNGSSATGSASATDSTKTDAAATEVSTEGKQLTVQIGPDPETIDPALNSAVDGGNMLLHSFECLLTIDQDGKIAPGQAETWEVSEDGLTWTFHLRDGLKWSDGSDLTADDFVYSWKRVCDPVVAAPYAETVLGMVKGFDEAQAGDLDALAVSAPDAKTFVVELSSPCPYFESLAAFATLSPVQQATVEANGDAWATAAETYISNGPFYITEWVPGSHITMSKNPNYWNADAIKLGSIKFVLMEDSNAAYTAYQSGDVLLIKDVPTQEIPSLQGNPEFHVEPLLGTYYLSLNLEDPAFADVNVRKALSLAIDRDYVANTLMQGTYSPAYNLVGEGWVDTDGSSFGAVPISSEGQQGLYANGYDVQIAQYVANRLGLKLEIYAMEWDSLIPAVNSGAIDAIVAGMSPTAERAQEVDFTDTYYESNLVVIIRK